MPLYTNVFANLDVTGNAFGDAVPENHNLVAWMDDPAGIYNTQLLTNGTVYLCAVYPARTASITKLYWWVTTAGATPTAGQNFVGIYSSAGSRLQTTNVDADISSTGLKSTTITAQTVDAGSFYWVGMVFNAATAPTVARGPSVTGIGTAGLVGQTAATYRFATNGTSQTSLPASITPSSNTAGAFAGPWVAIGV